MRCVMLMMCEYSVIMITLQENKLFSMENFVQNSLENPFRWRTDSMVLFLWKTKKKKCLNIFVLNSLEKFIPDKFPMKKFVGSIFLREKFFQISLGYLKHFWWTPTNKFPMKYRKIFFVKMFYKSNHRKFLTDDISSEI